MLQKNKDKLESFRRSLQQELTNVPADETVGLAIHYFTRIINAAETLGVDVENLIQLIADRIDVPPPHAPQLFQP